LCGERASPSLLTGGEVLGQASCRQDIRQVVAAGGQPNEHNTPIAAIASEAMVES
jgi:hypothetical protein